MIPQTSVKIQFTLNGEPVTVEVGAEMTALAVIRDLLGKKGTKEGCGIGECGACTIQVDDQAVNACIMPAAQLDGCRINTVEGLEQDGKLHPLQKAMHDHHAVQCGFCTPGVLMSADALLKVSPHPHEDQIQDAVAGNLCRCTGYQQILSSIRSVAGKEDGHD